MPRLTLAEIASASFLSREDRRAYLKAMQREPVRVVRKGSYQGVPQWGCSDSPDMTPSKATAERWARIANANR